MLSEEAAYAQEGFLRRAGFRSSRIQKHLMAELRLLGTREGQLHMTGIQPFSFHEGTIQAHEYTYLEAIQIVLDYRVDKFPEI